MTYLYEYLVFLAEAITIVVAILAVFSVTLGMSMRAQQDAQTGRLRVRKINDLLRDMRYEMEAHLLPPDAVKKQHKAEAKAHNQAMKAQAQALKKGSGVDAAPTSAAIAAEPSATTLTDEEDTDKESTTAATAVEEGENPPESRLFYLKFDGDVKASAVDHLSTEISAVLTMATAADEVVVAVESPGGMVHSYGLAASQLTRIRNKGIPLTVVVDKVAASGGYLMAAVADKILAAPFALLGSIGVVAQIPNVHRLLKKNDVDVEVLTAGKHKRTLTTLGENTEEGRQKFIEELEDVHNLFQEFVGEYRPQLDMDTVATGEAWYGRRSLDHKLVDELATSDEYLMAACDTREVYAVTWEEQKRPMDKLLGRVSGLIERADEWLSLFTRR